jgi:hypothetical protein
MTTSHTTTATARLEGDALILAARYLVFAPCDACGDDLDIHDWIDVDPEGMMVNCDRKEG